jgi:hypothetical protein
MNGKTRPALRLTFPFAALVALAVATACSSGFFRTLMEGKNGAALAGSLKITPAAATIPINGSLTLQVAGGDGNYTFSLVGGGPGTFNSATKVYTAPGSAGTATLQVTDGAGGSAQAVLNIVDVTGPDYTIALAPATVFPVPGAGGAAFTGSFKIENISSQAGADTLSWQVYISPDNKLDSFALPLQNGTLPAMGASSVSGSIPYSGTWPAATATHYIIIAVAALDDVNTTNNQTISPAIAVTFSGPQPAYSITSVSPMFTTLVQSSAAFTNETLNIANIGSGAGNYPVAWAVYLLTNTTINLQQDTAIASGTTASLGPTASVSVPFLVTGSYPSAPGTYYFVAKVSAFDDTAGTGKKVLPSSPIIVSGPNYIVQSIGAPTGNTAGGAVSGNFTIANTGSANGASLVSWSVFASTTTTLGAGDALIASGTTAALASGATSLVPPTYSGSWPSVAGSYYIIVRVQAADDATVGVLASASPVAVAGPTYTVTPVSLPTGTSKGGPVSGSFTINNVLGSGNGASSIAWSVFASLNNTGAVTAGDSLIATGTTGPVIVPGNNTSVPYSGTWPDIAGLYYIKALVQAADAASIGVGVAGSAVTVN